VSEKGANIAESLPHVSPVTSTVAWPTVVGAQLEELLWGLVDEMGASNMIWRAGSVSGVAVGDGGRDIEATVKTPNTDGSSGEERWWFEAKGRSTTIRKAIVSEAVINATAFPEVDVIAICSNSIFANSAHDWAREWNRTNRKPRVLLWDRENMAAMVRRAPLVAARVLPEALSDADRLTLLIERFHEFGETPSLVDLEYFWSHSVSVADYGDSVAAVTLFLFSDDEIARAKRPWTSLLQNDGETARAAALHAVFLLPRMMLWPLVRRVDQSRVFPAAAQLLVWASDYLEPSELAEIVQNPFKFFDGMEQAADRESTDNGWQTGVVQFILSRIQDEMADVCASDCARVITERSAFPAAVDAERYFDRFQPSEPHDSKLLTLINIQIPCAVGLEMGLNGECLVTRNLVHTHDANARFFRELSAILDFRRVNPTGQYLAFAKSEDLDIG